MSQKANSTGGYSQPSDNDESNAESDSGSIAEIITEKQPAKKRTATEVMVPPTQAKASSATPIPKHQKTKQSASVAVPAVSAKGKQPAKRRKVADTSQPTTSTSDSGVLIPALTLDPPDSEIKRMDQPYLVGSAFSEYIFGLISIFLYI